ncbi:MAG: penicillin-binding transpeptidase domain-containing protein [Desulfobacteraceae bacterium]
MRRLPWLGLCAGGCFFILVTIFWAGSWIFAHFEGTVEPAPEKPREAEQRPQKLAREDLPKLLGSFETKFFPVSENYAFENQGSKLTVETSIDSSLQSYIYRILGRSMTFQAAVIALRPDNGQVLALANYNKDGRREEEDLCLKADFPAASLFKIVAAAAAIEQRGFTPDTNLFFRGKRHTLYRSQLKEGRGRYTRKTTLKKAFSGSINPVFGKMGIYDLGQSMMNEYASRFLFNQVIPFDLQLAMSNVHVPEDDFGLAEIASGFNKRTLVSPLHVALITAAIANQGTMMAPWLVGRVKDESGRILYQATPSILANPINEKTAKDLKALMKDTIVAGTCRTAFRPLRRKRLFKKIELGAKTGTINDSLDQYKYDWLTAYALPNNGDKGLCLTILAVHGKRLGIRANDLARHILNHHFTYK